MNGLLSCTSLQSICMSGLCVPVSTWALRSAPLNGFMSRKVERGKVLVPEGRQRHLSGHSIFRSGRRLLRSGRPIGISPGGGGRMVMSLALPER